MKKIVMSVLVSAMLMIGLGFLVTQAYHVGVAQAQSQPIPMLDAGPVDAGLPEGTKAETIAVPGTGTLVPDTTKIIVPDPSDDPGGFWETMTKAKAKGAWLGFILVGLYGLVKLLGKASTKFAKLAFFAKPSVAMIIAGAGTFLSGCIDTIFLGGSFATVIVSGIWALVGWLGTAKKA